MKTFETGVVLTGKGKSAQDAFIDAIGKMQRQVTTDVKGTIIRIEPLEVVFLEGKEVITTEKYFFFFMKREVSKFTVKIEVKAKPRTGETVFLCLMTLTTSGGEMPSVKLLNTYMDKLHESIKKSLRENDVFAQYSVSQFVLMLPLTTYENGEKALARVEKAFRKQYPYCPLAILYSLQPIDAEEKE